MYITVKVRVSFHWTLFALCSLCVCACACVLSEAQFSCLVWCADGWVGACWRRECLSLLVSFPLPYLCSLSSLFVRGFTCQLHPWLPALFHHCICWGPSLGWGEFSTLYFPPPFFFTRLSGLSAAAIHGGFGMKCLLTEPCAPELR